MRSHLVIVIVLFSVALFGCQAASPVSVKGVSAATCNQDVVAAWNQHCAANNFEAVTLGTSATMGDVYLGVEFAKDAGNLLQDIQDELNSSHKPSVGEGDELVSGIVGNPLWFF